MVLIDESTPPREDDTCQRLTWGVLLLITCVGLACGGGTLISHAFQDMEEPWWMMLAHQKKHVIREGVASNDMRRLEEMADLIQFTGEVKKIKEDDGKVSAIVLSALSAVDPMDSGVLERLFIQEDSVLLGFDIAPTTHDQVSTRTHFSAVLSGEQNAITDSMHSIIVGGSGNHVVNGRRVILANVHDRYIKATSEAHRAFIDGTMITDSLQIDGGIRTTEVIISPSQEGSNRDDEREYVYEIDPEDYLVIVDPQEARKSSSKSISVKLPPPESMHANQQIVIRSASKHESTHHRGKPMSNEMQMPVYVTCTRNATTEMRIVETIVEDKVKTIPKEATAVTLDDADGVYVTCMSQRSDMAYNRYLTTWHANVHSVPVSVTIPVFVQRMYIDESTPTLWLVWSVYAQTWMILSQ